ncbi:MAG TPA: hypothetical protein PLT28_00135 [Saprospiraceae bacterium]|nr:hypothetical protein [Saprospiraceae bacterium]
MNEEERIKEIRARCEAYKSDRSEATKASIGLTEEELILDGYLPSFSSLAAHVSQDIPFLLDLIESLRAQLSKSQRREKAAAMR